MSKPITRISQKLRARIEAIPGVREFGSRSIEVYIEDPLTPGRADADKTEESADKVRDILGWGGYMTGYGGWYLSKDFVFQTEWQRICN